MPKRILIGMLPVFAQKGMSLTPYIASMQDKNALNDYLLNTISMPKYKKNPTDRSISFWHETVNI